MKPIDFSLHRPTTLRQATDLLAGHADDAKVLAGGQSLLPLLNFRLARPEHLIDLALLGGLSEVHRDARGLWIGAMTRHAYIEHSAAVAQTSPLLAAAMPHIAHPPIRNRGTVGGSLAHADPAAELPAVARALDATFHAVSVRGTRRIPATEFFRTHLTTALAPDEILTQVHIPAMPARSGAAFLEVGRRRGDFALVGVAVQLTMNNHGIDQARICFSGVADTPHRSAAAEAVLRNTEMTADVIAAAAAAARDALHPSSDLHATADYRTHLAGVLLGRALQHAHTQALTPHLRVA